MIYKVHYFSCLPFPFSAFASFRLKRSNPYFWILTLTLAALSNPKQISAQQNNVSFQVFYDALSPYGQWVDYQNYGYVWIPDVSPEFAPYSSDGYWILTDYGWTWVSDYEWGWAPFH